MSKARWSEKDFKDNGLIMVDGVYVKASSQVAKGKVDKIVPGERFIPVHPPITGYTEAVVKSIKEQAANPDKPYVHWEEERPKMHLDQSCIPPLTTDHIMEAFCETGYVLTEPIPRGEYYGLPTGELVPIRHRFEINPCPAPRMSRSDKWKVDPYHPDPKKRQRKPVTKYFAWRDAFRLLCAEKGYVLEETIRVIFVIPMPKSISNKERDRRRGQAHKQRPDTDNMIKSIKDSFNVDDGYVWDERSVKVWADKGEIIIF